MIIPGLCSITFRKLTPEQIIELVVEAGLKAIEWGGDVHVPHGDPEIAEQVRDWTLAAGLAVSSYGSYYRAADDKVSFQDTLRSAEILETKIIRVWAGTQGAADSSPVYFDTVVEDLRKCAVLAAEKDISLALEFHDGTLTDSNEAAVRLLEAVPEVSIIWQPKTLYDIATRLKGLKNCLPRLSNLHVFQWAKTFDRLPLSDGENEWLAYFSLASSLPGDRYALMEFTANDSPETFLKDAKCLLNMVRWHDGTSQNGPG